MLLAYLFCDIYIPTLSDNYDTFHKLFLLVVILRRHNFKILGRPSRRLGSGWLNSIWSNQPLELSLNISRENTGQLKMIEKSVSGKNRAECSLEIHF